MKIQHLPPDNWSKLFNTLQKGGHDFQEVETKKKRYLVWHGIKYYNDPNPPRLNLEDLGRVSATKKEIQKNIKNLTLPDHIGKDYFLAVRAPYEYFYEYTEKAIFGGEGPEYYQNRRKTHTEGQAIQIDINAAYLTAVKNLKLITEKTYNKFFEEETDEKKRAKKAESSRHRGHAGEVYKYSKDSRLISVGSLAQDKTIIYYTAGKQTHRERQYNEAEANVFWTAAAEVGKVMAEILEACKGYFFWVDAVFLPADMKQKAAAILEKYGYKYHTKQIYITQHGGNFETIDTDTGEYKRYFVPPGKTTKFIETVNQDGFITDILEAYKEAYKIYNSSPEKQEKARQITARNLKKQISTESALNLAYLAKECQKIGFTLDDILKMRTIITERHKDAIFQNEILTETIIKRIEKISAPAPLPAPEEPAPDGGTIEREFLREIY